MPRHPRIYVKGSLYYITCRSLPNQNIFHEKEDYEMYFSLLKKYREEIGVKIYAYALLPGHLHLLLEMDETANISQLMHNLNSNYTKYFNSRYNRKGHLFRERYKAALVEKDPKLLLELTAYIHLNPRRLEMAMDAQTYPYSSYSMYLEYDQQNAYSLDIKNEITEIIGSLIGENYSEFVEKLEKSSEYEKLHNQLQRKGMAGSDEFIKKVRDEIELRRQPEPLEDKRPAQSGQKPKLNMATVVLMFFLTAGGLYVYFNFTRAVPGTSLREKPAADIVESLNDLNKTEWMTQLFSVDGTLVDNDILSFNGGKFSSAYLAQQAYPNTNYSMMKEGNKIIWETIQTSGNATASWYGEVQNGRMSGVLSLQQEGQPAQDFSFKSLRLRRK
ncbi:MAG: transposase [Candidatus Omnitrophica bacterium]|nr:transposase [Candidatus Omnitrophota bacterium]